MICRLVVYVLNLFVFGSDRGLWVMLVVVVVWLAVLAL